MRHGIHVRLCRYISGNARRTKNVRLVYVSFTILKFDNPPPGELNFLSALLRSFLQVCASVILAATMQSYDDDMDHSLRRGISSQPDFQINKDMVSEVVPVSETGG